MDGTFYSCPKKFYQLYNIIGKDSKTGIIIPLVFIIMSNKSYELYFHIFENIKNLFVYNNINIDFKDLYIMMDFEKGARRAIKTVFPQTHLLGCYFHFAKSLWNKAKKEGLTKKNLIKDTVILIFSLKIYVLYLQNIENFFKEKNEFKNMLKYFKKNWS